VEIGELLQAQEKEVDSPLEFVARLALVQPVPVLALKEQPHWFSPMEVELHARLLSQENTPEVQLACSKPTLAGCA